MTTFVDKVLLVDEALDARGVGHAFGGAIALAYAVLTPRATDDIDINVSVPTTDARRALSALPPPVPWGIDDLEAVARDGQVRLRWEGDRTPLDLFFPQHRFHEVVAAAAAPRPFAGRAIPVISPTHLTVFKTLFNRSKDWPDIEAMVRAGSVDTHEALGWVATLLGADHPQHARLAALVDAGGIGPMTDEMEVPPVDWRALGQ